MALNRGNFVRNVGTVGTTPIEARLAQAAEWAENAPGVPRSGVVWGAATNLVVANGVNMSYDISPAQIVIARAANEGVYVMTITGATNLATTAAPGSGSRFDLIYIKQNDPDKGDPDNAPVLGVVQGTSSTGTPTKPYGSVPAGAFVLAEAQIFSGTTFASGGANTMGQVFAWTAPRGAVLPIRDLTDRATITSPQAGARIRRLDRENWRQEHNGTGWAYEGWRRSTAAPTWSLAAGTASRSVGLISETKAYARVVNVYGRLTVTCPAISSGIEEINVAVSAGLGVVTSAQGKARLSYPPGPLLAQTAQVDAQGISIAAATDAQVRVWIEVVSGALSLTPSGTPFSALYFDYQPAAD